ncbi:DUF2877 domain-containing protein [Paenibacillus sp.]|uniref:DUF2877 domain-containing protein n=1 Tax=Paenibacillus sp. TaxID=58172 RepID=UPI0028ACE85C|nr:DUF2877 domain-containing protein [Paenibacillus sp.]
MIHAKSGDTRFLDRIDAETFYGTVHSTFNRTLNIRCLNSGELYTIACRDFDDGPNTIIADFADLRHFHIRVNESIYGMANQIRIGNQMILFTKNSRRWTCTLPDFPKSTSLLKKNLPIAMRYINEFGQGGGIQPCQQSGNIFDKEITRMLKERSDALLEAFIWGREQGVILAARQLLGLGPGLTPSGDDFLVGLFAVMNLQGSPLSVFKSLYSQIIIHAQQLTNEISFAALHQATQGQVRESMVQFIKALLNGNTETFFPTLSTVLGIGSSSGTDIAMGICSGLQLCCKNN